MNNMKHKIKLEKIAEGLNISSDRVNKFLNDGRIIGRLSEFIREEIRGSTRASSESSPYDITDNTNGREEVRSISKNGISFASSKEVGYGREVTEEGFKEKLDKLDIYVAVDFRDIENLIFHEITKDEIMLLEKNGKLGKNKRMSAEKIYEFLNRRSE
jgi:hypothetical protein